VKRFLATIAIDGDAVGVCMCGVSSVGRGYDRETIAIATEWYSGAEYGFEG
jgi:hypothetical protein